MFYPIVVQTFARQLGHKSERFANNAREIFVILNPRTTNLNML